MKIKAMKGKVLVTDLERGSRIINGIIVPGMEGKSESIRPRWGKVYSVGDDIIDIEVGQWILIDTNRWTRMLKVKEDDGKEVQVWGVEWPNSVSLVSDTEPEEVAIFSQFTS